MEIVSKTPDELTRIKAAVKANFLFQHLNDTQAKQVYDVMKRVAVKKGDVVIRQGDQVLLGGVNQKQPCLCAANATCGRWCRAIGFTWSTRASTS